MNEAAVKPGASYAHIRVKEPAGERSLGVRLTIGGEGADIVVPGTAPGAALTIERREAEWWASPEPGAGVRFDGRPLSHTRELHKDDVLSVGEAQIIVLDDSRTRLRLDVQHLAGNATIAPVVVVAAVDTEASDDDVEIRSTAAPGGRPAAAVLTADRPRSAYVGRKPLSKKWVATIAAVVLLLLGGTALVSLLEPVEIDVVPRDSRISTPGTLFSFHTGEFLNVLSGKHVVQAEHEGYYPAQVTIDVKGGGNPTPVARLRLAKLPGKLRIDTNGVVAAVLIDGVESGRAPGEVEAPPGSHTITLRAARYVDFITNVNVEGLGKRQDVSATLQPSWGTLKVIAVPAGANVTVDGKDGGKAPATIEADSGVRHVQISAPGLKTWESSVVVKAGETLAIGPITLGQPDAELTLRSDPSGAEITVAGTYRGRTPVKVDLPAGVAHSIVATLPGYANWTKSVFAEPGKKITLDAKLQPVLAGVAVDGEPTDAELFIDGKPHGRTPQKFELSATEHSVEVRKEGYLPFKGSVTPALGLERAVQYKLTSADRGKALLESAPTIKAKATGYELRLVPGGTFKMGSERREQGRRPNEGYREVTLKRPFYIGVTEVTNADFRSFKSDHVSGFLGKRSFDLDAQPVVQVTWNDAAAYCNWLSEREGLPPAYEQGGGKYVLIQPVTTGYRLPTEAEWEYAARYAAPGQMRKFPWGDSLPVVQGTANIAGEEAKGALESSLDGYRDEYPVVAPVGKFQPTPLGLHDMGGNVSEWVNDFYLSYVDSTPVTDPLGPEQAARHVVRGANWRSANVAELRYAYRDSADEASQTIGFRVARYAE
ncbi:MAG TPA: PEGA domain-containing protein [Steroidobacteraceae bacterium]|nr:PEGA domain-containing protein [Steroidobacteraceae bacterium]